MEQVENINKFDDNGLNIGQLNSMLNEIETMSVDQHQQILKIMECNKSNYTENENGIFVKLNTLSIDVILKIYEFVESIRNSKNDIETAVQTFESYEHMNKPFLNKNVQSNNSDENSTNMEIEDWKIAIIEKMRNTSKAKTKKNKTNNKIKE